jgi:hypothetical protein
MAGASRKLPGRAWLSAAIAGAILCAGGVAGDAEPAAAGGSGLELRRGGSFDLPVHVDSAPGKRKLLFVVEQRGTIGVVGEGRGRGAPFLGTRDRVPSS